MKKKCQFGISYSIPERQGNLFEALKAVIGGCGKEVEVQRIGNCLDPNDSACSFWHTSYTIGIGVYNDQEVAEDHQRDRAEGCHDKHGETTGFLQGLRKDMSFL